MNNFWYTIEDINTIDTPALAVYHRNVLENIELLKSFCPDVNRLRPHCKTHKSSEVTKLLLNVGINKFKCATIAEAEMLAEAGAPDVLLAYQPVGPKISRLLGLVSRYSKTSFSCLVDNVTSADEISAAALREQKVMPVFVDLNVGMNRTGIEVTSSLPLFQHISTLKGIELRGLHAYDGHLRDPDIEKRTAQCNDAFAPVEALHWTVEKNFGRKFTIIAGGTPTFPIHAKRENVECSPGTFIYWDRGYHNTLHEQPFLFGALVITRVISKPTANSICVDLGHKAIASENTLDKRVSFLNAPNLVPIGHSEEHMVLEVPEGETHEVGDVLYGVPYHICPTVALHQEVIVVSENRRQQTWPTTARNRKITL